MENINLSAYPVQIRAANNGFIVTNAPDISDMNKIREEHVFTSLEALFEFLVDRFVDSSPQGLKDLLSERNPWDSSGITTADAVWGGGS